jgi:adenylate cyclase
MAACLMMRFLSSTVIVAAVTHAVESNDGRITSVAGDGVTGSFGAGCDARKACQRSILALQQIWRSLDVLNKDFEIAFGFPLRFGAGCHLGLAIVGDLASHHTTQFLGEVGNIAARLETFTKELDCTIILSHAVIERAGLVILKPESHRIQIKNVTTEIDLFAFRTQSQLDALISTSD